MTKGTVSPRDITDAQIREIPIEQNDADLTEANILSAFEAGDENVAWKINVYKLDRSAGNAEEYLFQIVPDELEGLWDRLRDSEGTGTYRVRVYRKQGSERQVIFRQYDRKIKAPSRPQAAPERQSEMSAVLAAMNERDRRMEQLLERVLAERTVQSAPQAPASPFSQLTEIVTVMTNLQTVMRPAVDQTISTVEAIMKGVELATKVSGEKDGGSGETNWMDLVKEFIKSPMAAQIAAQPQPTQVQQPQPLPPRGQKQVIGGQHQPEQVKPQQTQANPQETAIQEQLKQSVTYLCQKAASGADTQLYADWVWDNWPREMITGMLAQPNALTLLTQFAPQAQHYLPWFQRLLAELKMIAEDETSAQTGNPRSDAVSDTSPVQPYGDTGGSGGGESDAEGDE